MLDKIHSYMLFYEYLSTSITLTFSNTINTIGVSYETRETVYLYEADEFIPGLVGWSVSLFLFFLCRILLID